MTIKEQICDVLQNYPLGLSPTSIGIKIGFTRYVASARVNTPLRQLCEEKEVIKIKEGRKAIYKLKNIK